MSKITLFLNPNRRILIRTHSERLIPKLKEMGCMHTGEIKGHNFSCSEEPYFITAQEYIRQQSVLHSDKEVTIIKKPVISYSGKGIVWGNNWGSGKSGYPSETIEGKSLNELKTKAEKMLKNGSLDSGMGYESLYGAFLFITRKETILVKGKEFVNTQREELIIGTLTNDEINRSRNFF